MESSDHAICVRIARMIVLFGVFDWRGGSVGFPWRGAARLPGTLLGSAIDQLDRLRASDASDLIQVQVAYRVTSCTHRPENQQSEILDYFWVNIDDGQH